jgi:proteasome lid subunit RPN8/RPN11
VKLMIESRVAEALSRAALAAAPLEACGLCGGRDGRVTEFHALTNADASAEHFSMLPAEQFKAIKAMRASGAALAAIWHSHPATPARLSDEDLRLAWTPDTVYLITSLAGSGGPVTRGYVVTGGRPEPVDLEECS